MIKYLRCFKLKGGRVVARVETKSKKYGVMLEQSNVCVKDKCVVFAGAHHSGKTRALQKIHEQAEAMYAVQLRPYSPKTKPTGKNPVDTERLEVTKTMGNNWRWHKPVFIGANLTLAQWVDNEDLCAWWCNKNKLTEKDFKKVKQYEKLSLIRDYLKETRALLFVDDAHKFVGKKIQYFKDYFNVSSRVLMSCESESRLPESIRLTVMRTNPTIHRFNTDVSYDMTHVMMWFLLIGLLLAGQYEIALLLGGLKMLASGRGATKQTV